MKSKTSLPRPIIIYLFTAVMMIFISQHCYADENADETKLQYDNLYYIIKDSSVEIVGSEFGVYYDYEIPDTIDGYPVSEIGEKAFFGRTLTSIVIPDTVTAIGEYAFANNSALVNIMIPASVSSIGEGAFWGCNIEEFNVDPGNAYYHSTDGVLIENKSEKIIAFPKGIQNGAKTTYEIPDAVKEIGGFAFDQCLEMDQLVIPEQISYIGEAAFRNCDIGSFAVSPRNENYASIDGVLFEKSTKKLIAYPSQNTGEYYEVPDGITEIGKWAFQNCKNVQEIHLPETITKIGIGAFALCDNLNTVNIPDRVTEINDYTFKECYGLNEVSIPEGVTRIGQFAISRIPITSVTLPDSLLIIDEMAFQGCEYLTEITIPAGVTEIGDNAFEDCDIREFSVSSGNQFFTSVDGVLFDKDREELICYPKGKTESSYTIPSETQRIAGSAFYESSLEEIQIPDTVKEIGKSAFNDCENLTSIVWPESASTIEPYTFGACFDLEYVTIPESVSSISDDAFNGTSENMTLIVEKNSFAEEYAINNNMIYQYPDSTDWLDN